MDFEEQPLQGKNILVTRPREQAFEFASMLLAEGANVFLLPTISITATNDYTEINNSLRNIHNYNWIVYSSVNGVKFFMERLKELGIGIKSLAGIKIAAGGPATARLIESHGLAVDFIPAQHTSKALAEGLENVRGEIILAPVTDISDNEMKEILEAKDAKVDEVVFYHTANNEVAKEYIEQTFKSGIDIITFTSSSAVSSLIEMVKPLGIDLKDYCIACIGTVTAETAKENGLEVSIVGNPFTIEGLISGIKKSVMADIKLSK